MRVITANIWARYGPYERRAPLLRGEIASLSPDVMTLQEVDGGDGGSQAHELFGPLGYNVAYWPREGPNRGDPGIAVASRGPILRQETLELPHDGVVLAARTELAGEALWICCAVPLSWLPGREGEREDEVVRIDDWLATLASGDPLPPILAGDFDATPDAASIRFLTGLQSLQGRSTFWTDAWDVAGDGSLGATWSSSNPYVGPFSAAVFGQPEHHRRIDYVFVGSPERWNRPIYVRECRVVLREAGDVAPSDHYGVMADLELGPPADAEASWEDRWPGMHEALWGHR